MLENFKTTTNQKEQIPRTPESYFENLNNLLGKISEEINNDAKKNQAEQGKLINPDCTIARKSFAGIISAEKIARDDQYIADQQKRYAPDPAKESVQNYYGTSAPDEIRQIWQENKKRSSGSLMEMATTGIFYKILKDKFLVVRASVYDDYHNGIDNVLVDKETGQVICAFDEIRVGGSENDKQRLKEKFNKINNKLRQGGSKLDYGLTFGKEKESGEMKLVRKTIKNIPIFCLGLSQEELNQLLAGMNYNLTAEPSQEETEIFDKLITQIEAQKNLLTSVNLEPELKKNLNGLDDILEKIKNIRKQ